MSREASIIKECKAAINRADFAELQGLYEDLMLTDWSPSPSPDWAYILQQVYIHACLKKQRDAAAWLEQLFLTRIDPIAQAAYRHTLNYGRYLLRTR
jgi:hypothetical protein